MKTIIFLSSITLFLQYSYPKLQIIQMKFSATSQMPILLSWSSSSLRGVSLITLSITATILGSSLLKGVKMSYWTYSWQTSNSTVHKFLYTDQQTLLTKQKEIYLNVPSASSTTSRFSSLSNLISPVTAPFESSNLRFALLETMRLDILAAAQARSVASGEDN